MLTATILLLLLAALSLSARSAVLAKAYRPFVALAVWPLAWIVPAGLIAVLGGVGLQGIAGRFAWPAAVTSLLVQAVLLIWGVRDRRLRLQAALGAVLNAPITLAATFVGGMAATGDWL